MIVQIPFGSFKEINIRRQVPFMGMVLAVLILLLINWEPSLVLFLFFLGYRLVRLRGWQSSVGLKRHKSHKHDKAV